MRACDPTVWGRERERERAGRKRDSAKTTGTTNAAQKTSWPMLELSEYDLAYVYYMSVFMFYEMIFVFLSQPENKQIKMKTNFVHFPIIHCRIVAKSGASVSGCAVY